jgi:uncharacterized membrane protein
VPKRPVKKPRPASPKIDTVDSRAAEVAKRLQPVLNEEQRELVVAEIVSVYKEEQFTGPIAHPDHMQDYEAILPGSAHRIIAMAEKSLQHQMDMERDALAADVADQRAGRIFGMIALMALVLAAVVCGLLGKEILAGLFVGAGALGTIGAFINGRDGGKD